MAHALVHILGSRAGYTTLDASGGVSAAERSELEVLSFGDATNAEAMDRLEANPSMIGRRLRSGRFAISRMLPGGSDDAGRPTIEVVTLVVDETGYSEAVDALPRLAADSRIWRLARASVSRGMDLAGDSAQAVALDKGALQSFDAWIAARQQGATAVLADARIDGLFAMLRGLDPDDQPQCRWGIGVLSLSAPVDVCTLAPTTAPIGPRPVLRVARGGGWLSDAMPVVLEYAAREGRLPPAGLIGSLGPKESPLRASEPGVWRERRTQPDLPAVRKPDADRPARRSTLLPMAAISATCSVLLLGVMIAVYRASTNDRPFERTAVAGEPDGQVMSTPGGSAPAIAPAEPVRRPGEPPREPSRPSGYAEINAIPVPSPAKPVEGDRDGDGLADSQDPCPDGGELLPYFLDADGDEVGSGEAQQICAAKGAASVEAGGKRYVAKDGDLCDSNKDRLEPITLYIDADGDGLGAIAPSPTQEIKSCDAAVVEGTATIEGQTWSDKQGDKCDHNEYRTDPMGCGCDWRAVRDEDFDRNDTLDCFDDDDMDGLKNMDDSVDGRVELLEQLIGTSEQSASLRGALQSLRDGLDEWKDLAKEVKVWKPSPDDPKAPPPIENWRGRLASGESKILDAVRALYSCADRWVFLDPLFRSKPVGSNPDIIAIAKVDQFEPLFDLIREMGDIWDRLGDFKIGIRQDPKVDALQDRLFEALSRDRGDTFDRELGRKIVSYLKQTNSRVDPPHEEVKTELGRKIKHRAGLERQKQAPPKTP